MSVLQRGQRCVFVCCRPRRTELPVWQSPRATDIHNVAPATPRHGDHKVAPATPARNDVPRMSTV
eukprot:12904191-Prorocentrum_lima.AAC.1